jgi:hypothetical protein
MEHKEYNCQVYLIDHLGQQHYSHVCFFWMDFLFTQGNKPIKEEDESMIRKIVDGMNV